jgi:TATA-binding protein-associated factor Taf7
MEVGTKQLPDSDFSLNLAKKRKVQEDNKESASKNANKKKENKKNDSKEENGEENSEDDKKEESSQGTHWYYNSTDWKLKKHQHQRITSTIVMVY